MGKRTIKKEDNFQNRTIKGTNNQLASIAGLTKNLKLGLVKTNSSLEKLNLGSELMSFYYV